MKRLTRKTLLAWQMSPLATRLALWVLAMATLLVSGWLHWRAAYTMPFPWRDEPWYLWTSVELCHSGHWASPSLRPGPALVLSPLYALLNAALFKVFGVGLGIARWGSWACLSAAYWGVLRLFRGRRWQLPAAAVASWFALAPAAIAAGNMVRPEAMLWMLAVWGFAMLSERRIALGLILLGLGLNLHSLGWFFYAGGLVLALVRAWEKHVAGEPWPLSEKIGLGVAAVILVACAVSTVSAFDSSVFAAAYAEDHSTLLSRLGKNLRWAWLLAAGALVLRSLFTARKGLESAVLAGMGMATIVLRNQVWYRLYEQQAFGLLVVCAMLAVAEMRPWRFEKGRSVLGAALAAGLLLLGCRLGYVQPPDQYPCKLEWVGGMFIDPVRTEYLPERDIEAVSAEIAKRVAGKPRPVKVLFLPEADGLYFHDRLPDGVIPYEGVHTDVPGDVGVFHFSRALGGHRRHRAKTAMRDFGWNGEDPFYANGDSDLWFFADRTALPPSGTENAAPSAP